MRKTVATVIEREQGAESASSQLGRTDRRITERHYIERDITAIETSSTLGRFAPTPEP